MKWFSRIALVLFSLLVAELALRLLGLAIPQIHALTGPRRVASRVIQHPVLGVVGNPDFFEHDDRGFRNATTLSSAPIVALGDSHTYGTSVEAGRAWPAVLARKLGSSVYNMGMGGYGAAHNVENLPMALDLDPDLVIFALYFGNDFYEDFQFAVRNDLLATIISSQAAADASRLEEDGPLADQVDFLYRSGAATNEELMSDVSLYRKALRSVPENVRLVGLLRAFKIFLDGHYGSALLDRDFESAKNSLTSRQRPFVSVFDGVEWKTLLTAPYRLRVMDDSDPRIRSGIEVTKRMILRMRDRVDEAGADFLVLLFPTKEYVFWPKIAFAMDHPQLDSLVATEERLRGEVEHFLRAERIRYVDPSPALRKLVEQPYYPNGDGHPNPLGHEVIASELVRELGQR